VENSGANLGLPINYRITGELATRSVVRVAERKAGDSPTWLTQLIGRRHKNVAAVALANKNARIVWALLAHDRDYQGEYVPAAA
jgi:transposase